MILKETKTSFERDFESDAVGFRMHYEEKYLDVLDLIAKESKSDIFLNLIHFFGNTNLIFFEDGSVDKFEESDVLKKVRWHCCWSDTEYWCCNIASPYAADKTDNLDCYFGFAKQLVGGSKKEVYGMEHSFNVRNGRIFDLKTQVVVEAEKGYAERFDWERPRLLVDDMIEFAGVKIPSNVVHEILWHDYTEERKVTGNLWGYIKNHVLHSRELTDQLIECISNNGKDFVYHEKPA